MRISSGLVLALLFTGGGRAVAQDTEQRSIDGKVETPRRFVLTGNPDDGEMSLDAGATYTAAPAYTNPANDRLIDGDKPEVNWNTVAGINQPAQTVTFDLKNEYVAEEIALHFRQAQRPSSVAVSTARQAGGPWQKMGVLRFSEQTEGWWRLKRQDGFKSALARYVRLDFQIRDWGWYLSEVKIYGRPLQQSSAPRRSSGELVLAENGRPHSVIVVADRAYPHTLRAATLFRTFAERMTGVRIPIMAESLYDGKSAAILVGDSALARRLGVVVEQTPFGDDRYILRGGGKRNFVALVGNDFRFGDAQKWHIYRGSLYAVYDFFERQGFGWYGPDALWQVTPKTGRLTASALNVEEIPAFAWRHLWMTGLPMVDETVREAWRLGGRVIWTMHYYDKLVPPEKYKAEHPEWFGESQPDITHPEVIRIAVESLSEQMRKFPNDALMTLPVSSNDAGGYRNPPFRPEVGNIAAQQLHFANQVAEGLRKKLPNRRFLLGFTAYWHSHDGPVPMLRAEPEVVIKIVNEGNHSKPLEWPESEATARATGRNNTRELRAFERWKQTGGLQGAYEWWIPVLGNKVWSEIPWYDGDTAVRNLRFWRRNGIKYLDYEAQGESNAGFPLRWAQYYVGARAMWNPKVNPREVLSRACQKLYGPAGATMLEFYSLQQTAMRHSDQQVGNWSLPLPHLLYPAEIEMRGESLLQKAALQAVKEDEKKRIAVESAQWKRMRELNAAARMEKQQVYKVVLDGIAMNRNEQIVNAATVRALFELPLDVSLEVVEFDGQTRFALPGETYDLASGVTFRTRGKNGP